MSSGEWLERLGQFATNRPPDDWLRQHESALRATIAHDLYYAPELRNAFELLVNLVHIFVVEFFHPTEWESVLFDALLQAQELQDRPTMVRVYAELGAAYYAMGRNKRALSAFEIALDRARSHEFEKMELAAYIGLIRLQATNLSTDFEPGLFARALERSQQGAHDETKAALYQALALVYINRWQLTEGLNWARRAFYLWRSLGEDMEIAKTCYLLAVGNRMGRKFDRARYWIDRAETYFSFVTYELQDLLVYHERGAILYQQDEHVKAENELTIALHEAERLSTPHHRYATEYMLGATEIELKKYADAEGHLQLAREGWRKLGNKYEITLVELGFCYLNCTRSDWQKAKDYLQNVQVLIGEIKSHTQQMVLAGYVRFFQDKYPELKNKTIYR